MNTFLLLSPCLNCLSGEGVFNGGYICRAGRFLRRLLQSFWKDKTVLNLGRSYKYGEVFRGHGLKETFRK